MGTATFVRSIRSGLVSIVPDHMFIALEYVDEFVADSDKYPIRAVDG